VLGLDSLSLPQLQTQTRQCCAFLKQDEAALTPAPNVPAPRDQQAADELGGYDLVGGAGEQGAGEVLGGRGGYGSGLRDEP